MPTGLAVRLKNGAILTKDNNMFCCSGPNSPSICEVKCLVPALVMTGIAIAAALVASVALASFFVPAMGIFVLGVSFAPFAALYIAAGAFALALISAFTACDLFAQQNKEKPVAPGEITIRSDQMPKT